VYGVELADRHAPWHPGRCAALRLPESLSGTLVEHAGELHPKDLETLRLPRGRARWSWSSTHPADRTTSGAGRLAVPSGAARRRLFDVYAGPQVGEGRRSLAFALRLRAPVRTLTLEEASAVRDAAVALAGERHGARLR